MENAEKAKYKEKPSLAGPLMPGTPNLSGLQPKGLDFTTPKSSRKSIETSLLMTPSTPDTPATPHQGSAISDVESLCSEASSVTPEMSKLSLGKSRGRPRKSVEKPNMDDFPFDRSKEEQKRYLDKKNTEMWHYKKLSGSGSAEYRRSETQRVKKYNEKMKKEAEEMYDSTESSKEKQRKQQRER